MKQNLTWQVGFCDLAEARPSEYFEATVPGAVQLDYAKKYNLPDFNRGTNYKQFKWMEDKFWVYKTEFHAQVQSGNKLFLVCRGIDYKYDIFANGEKLCSYEGMYRTQQLDLTRFAGQKVEIEIVIYPIPRSNVPINDWSSVHKDTRDEANQCCKPAVSYGWDFHPRLVPLGIWEEIYLEERPYSANLYPRVTYQLSEDLTSATVFLSSVGIANTNWKFLDPNGNIVFTGKGEQTEFVIENIQLWWCNGYGTQPLYRAVASVPGMDDVTVKVGFKKVELVKSEGSWEEGLNYPMSRNTPPITVRLNNRVIFTKGSNWVCPEIFYGKLNDARYREQLELVKGANLNFVRCWGGAVINKDSFYDICDEFGIMVWQEFPLACNNYVGTNHYISVLKTEAQAIIDRIGRHACMMLWCGGNELFNNWSCMTDQDVAIRLMNKYTLEMTPGIPFISCAPVMGMAHGPYSFNVIDGREVIQVLPESHATAYTEFGGGGFSTVETLEQIADLKDLMPMTLENEVAIEHGEHWASIQMERYFGKVETLDEIIRCGQFMQCVGQQFIFEEARRQKPYCSIVSNWCFNEPWPNTGNNSLVCYPNNIKPAYYAVARACRSVLASARYRKLVYIAGETLDFDLFLLNDSYEQLPNGRVEVSVKIGELDAVKLMDWDYSNVAIHKNVAGPTVRYTLPMVENADTLEIILSCGEYSSKYTLLYRLPQKPANAPKKMNAILDENG